MADRTLFARFTADVGTIPALPQHLDFTLPRGYVRRIELKIPPGHMNLTGIRITAAGSPVLPASKFFITSDDDEIHTDFFPAVESVQWGCDVYNTGSFEHVFLVRWFLDFWVASEVSSGIPLAFASGG